MGQKVNPIGMRVGINKDWRSRWFSAKKDFGTLLNEDLVIRALVKKKLENAAVAEVVIERYANRVRVNIHTARPGIVIGRKGADIERVRAQLSAMTGKEVYVEIQEVPNPDLNAQLVAENIGTQIERRVSFRRAMKRAIQVAMSMGARGIKIKVGGRLNGAELSRSESYKEGSIPLHTLSANIDYGFAEANTKAGIIGIKVWICRDPEKEKPANARGSRKDATYA